LDVDLDLPPQGKPIHYFTDTNVRKYRFGNGDAGIIDPSPLFTVDLCGHESAGKLQWTTEGQQKKIQSRMVEFALSFPSLPLSFKEYHSHHKKGLFVSRPEVNFPVYFLPESDFRLYSIFPLRTSPQPRRVRLVENLITEP